MNCNVRSFNRNFDTLYSIFPNDNLPSVFCLTETHFTPYTLQNISGYDSFHTLRYTDTASGGISIFVNDNLNGKKIDSLSYSNETIEICAVEFNFGKQNVIILGIHRPHSDSIENFTGLFSDILNSKLLKNNFCIVMGDLNICLLKPNNPNLNFSNLLFSNHFNPLITKATRFPQIEGEQPSCLDHIWINKFFELDTGIISIDVSDHLPTFLNLKIGSNNQEEKVKINFRVVNELQKSKFRELLSNYDWNCIKLPNVNLYAEKFIETVDNLYCTAFPLKSKYVSKRHNHNPWVTEDIKKLIEARRHYFQLYRLSLVTLAENKRYRNMVNYIIRKHKTKVYADLFEKSRNDLKNTWKTINSLLSINIKTKEINKIICNNITYTASADIANLFSDFFLFYWTSL